jgi:pimeloyl-ACP methyl ester carboxylesterase
VAENAPYFEDVGTGEPVVLLHAAIADSRQWDDQMAAFTKRYRVIRYDMQGFGQTPAADAPITRADELLDLLERLSLLKAHLVGVSNGGATALDFAVVYPERVGALVLVAPGVSGMRMEDLGDASLMEWDAAQEARQEEAVAAGDFARATEISMETWLGGYGRPVSAVSPAVLARVRGLTEHALRRAAERKPTPQLSPGAADRLSSVTAPTLLLVGEHELPNARATVDFLAQRIAGAQRVEFPNAAHWLNVEYPDRFNQVVLDFLATNAATSPARNSARRLPHS